MAERRASTSIRTSGYGGQWIGTFTAFSLGTMGAAAPARRKEHGRRCSCGQLLSIYNLGKLCVLCERRRFATFKTEE